MSASVANVLFVDDDPAILRMIVRRMTSRRPRWEIAVALGGRNGIDQLRRMRFEIIVTDIEMPVVDGLQVLAAARLYAPAALRVVMTGSPGIAVGCDAHLVTSKLDLYKIPDILSHALEQPRPATSS